MTRGLIDRYRSLPRVGKWCVWACGVLIGYLGVVEPAVNEMQRVSGGVEKLERVLARSAELTSSESSTGRMVREGMEAYGRPMMPDDPGNTPDQLQRTIDRILAEHGLVATKSEKSTVFRASRTELTDRARAQFKGGELQRLAIDVTFEADQKGVASVIAALERSPHVAAISRVRIDRVERREREGSPLVRATVSPEAWVLVRMGGDR